MLLPCIAIAIAAPCPPPPMAFPAVLSPDGDAHLLTASDSTACWWFIDDNGDPELVRHFDLLKSRPVGMRWDDRLQALCIDLVDAEGVPQTRRFPAPTATDTRSWGDPVQVVR